MKGEKPYVGTAIRNMERTGISGNSAVSVVNSVRLLLNCASSVFEMIAFNSLVTAK